ncbi:hypothetical protein BB558_000383 [Smittium angustum]|uniref:Uncharacterized protein n=1 Tax=Smittium angustum TaxID=133377 RepID=A0A2U1JEI5_SMIAN|nr:hypothetical protein BB558_000383 [Smittium angustum]
MSTEYDLLVGNFAQSDSNFEINNNSDLFKVLLNGEPSKIFETDFVKRFLGAGDSCSLLENNFSKLNISEKLESFKNTYFKHIDSQIEQIRAEQGIDQAWKTITAIGIACLNLFLQINWTGPKIDFDACCLLPKEFSEIFLLENELNKKVTTSNDESNIKDVFIAEQTPREQFDKWIIDCLQVSGEQAYSLTSDPLLLYISLYLLVKTIHKQQNGTTSTETDLGSWLSSEKDNEAAKSRKKVFPSANWWMIRALKVAQDILEEHSATLMDTCENEFKDLEEDILGDNSEFEIKANPSVSETRKLKAMFCLEFGLMYQYYHKNSKANEWLQRSQKESGLVWEITGAKGKRTRFQERNIAQLLVVAKSMSEEEETSMDTKVDTKNENALKAPKTLDLNDDTLLEKIEFLKVNDDSENLSISELGLDPLNQGNLSTIDQCILLGFCLEVKNENPNHGITTEQMLPFVTRVLENPNNWSVHTASLLQRSRLEADKSRTVQRSVLQIQALVDQTEQALESEAGVLERLAYFHVLALPSLWALRRELADRLVSIGAIKSALEIYQSLLMWDQTVNCYQILEKPHVAENLVRNRLKVNPNDPKLWSILGDLKQNPEYWNKAWEVSNNRYSRAMRSLGGYYFKHGKVKECIESYQNALVLNPLFDGSWYTLGCAALQAEDWGVAVNAFQHVVHLDNENAEAWNNLASVYLRESDKKLEAWNCLREALKSKYDNWQIWTNFLVTSVSIGQFASAIQAMDRIINLRVAKDGSKCVDVEILSIIIQFVSREQPSAAKVSNSRQRERNSRLSVVLENLLVNTISAKITDSPSIWRAMADFWFWRKDYITCLNHYEKAYRCISTKPEVCYEEASFENAVHYLGELVEMYKVLGPMKTIVPEVTKYSDGSSNTRQAGGDLESMDLPEHRSKTASVEKITCPNYKIKAKMATQSLVSKTKSHFEGTKTFEKLDSLLVEITKWE